MYRRIWTETITFPLLSNKRASTKFSSYTSKSRPKRKSRRRSDTRSWLPTVSRASTPERLFCEVRKYTPTAHTCPCLERLSHHRMSLQRPPYLATISRPDSGHVVQESSVPEPIRWGARRRTRWILVIRCVRTLSFSGACTKSAQRSCCSASRSSFFLANKRKKLALILMKTS